MDHPREVILTPRLPEMFGSARSVDTTDGVRKRQSGAGYPGAGTVGRGAQAAKKCAS